MALPNVPISPIPNNDPEVGPELWNTRYAEIDENFQDIDERVVSVETSSSDNQSLVNSLVASESAALQMAGAAHKELKSIVEYRMQTGECVFINTGVIRGCEVSASQLDARSLDITDGVVFFGNTLSGVSGVGNSAIVPINDTDSEGYCYSYIVNEGAIPYHRCTLLNESAPIGSVIISKVLVPSGSNEPLDIYLAECVLIDYRNYEPLFPLLRLRPVMVYIPFKNNVADNRYSIHFSDDSIRCVAKARNGFAAISDSLLSSLSTRWTITYLYN